MENNQNQYIIWIDRNVDNPENTKYSDEIKSINKELIKFKSSKNIDEAIGYMEKIKFEETKVIISGKLYYEFVKQFKENINDMYVSPKIIIFTMDKEKFIKNNKEYESNNDLFYKFGGVTTSFYEIKKFLDFEIIKKKKI